MRRVSLFPSPNPQQVKVDQRASDALFSDLLPCPNPTFRGKLSWTCRKSPHTSYVGCVSVKNSTKTHGLSQGYNSQNSNLCCQPACDHWKCVHVSHGFTLTPSRSDSPLLAASFPERGQPWVSFPMKGSSLSAVLSTYFLCILSHLMGSEKLRFYSVSSLFLLLRWKQMSPSRRPFCITTRSEPHACIQFKE